MELLAYHSNLNPLSVLDDESPITKSRCEKGGFIRPLELVQGESHQGLLDWHLRARWDAHVHLEFGDHFPVGKVTVRDLLVLVDGRIQFPSSPILFSPGQQSRHFRLPVQLLEAPSSLRHCVLPDRWPITEVWKEMIMLLRSEKLECKCGNNSKGQEEPGPITG
jgi:hypothetical protein